MGRELLVHNSNGVVVMFNSRASTDVFLLAISNIHRTPAMCMEAFKEVKNENI